MTDTKGFLTSKTIIVNLIVLVASLLSTQGLLITLEEQEAIALGIYAFIGIVLRIKTDKAIEGIK
jgi:hypothetical protein